jgi:hypothetical protein
MKKTKIAPTTKKVILSLSLGLIIRYAPADLGKIALFAAGKTAVSHLSYYV